MKGFIVATSIVNKMGGSCPYCNRKLNLSELVPELFRRLVFHVVEEKRIVYVVRFGKFMVKDYPATAKRGAYSSLRFIPHEELKEQVRATYRETNKQKRERQRKWKLENISKLSQSETKTLRSTSKG